MTWYADFTPQVRADLVGLDEPVGDALFDLLVEWSNEGPPLRGERTVAGLTFYEEVVVERYLLAYVVDQERSRFLLLWFRNRPGVY